MVAACAGFAGVFTWCNGGQEAVVERNDGFILPPLLETLSTIQYLTIEYVMGSSLIAADPEGICIPNFPFCHLQVLAWAAF